MDETLILTKTLHLAALLRDSQAGGRWRQMRQRITPEARSVEADPKLAGTACARLASRIFALSVRAGFRGRPVLLPFFLERGMRLSRSDIAAVLSPIPELKSAEGALYECLQMTAAVTGLLRHLGHGYPYSNLPYVEPDSTWCFLERVCEVPWYLSVSLVPPRPPGTLRSLSSILSESGINGDALFGVGKRELDEAVADLISSVGDSRELRELNAAFSSVSSLGLLRELTLARAEFDQRYAELLSRVPRGEDRDREAFVLVLEIYYSRNRVIRNYLESFERYEALLQRIYWLLQQIVFEEVISLLSTVEAQQLQQAMLVFGKDEIHVTAIAPTLARTLRGGQLVHLALPELGHAHDGIYQVLRWNFEWHVRTGPRAFTRLVKRWSLPERAISALNSRSGSRPLFEPSEEDPLMELVNGTSMGLPDTEGKETGTMTPLRSMSPTMKMDEVFGYPSVP